MPLNNDSAFVPAASYRLSSDACAIESIFQKVMRPCISLKNFTMMCYHGNVLLNKCSVNQIPALTPEERLLETTEDVVNCQTKIVKSKL